ncbi:MAG: hypothetical protein LPJ91_03870 [Pseudazoarcus pumilus]|nr:hypothetical protein [Pseudazoarcus pumilus]
MSDPTSSAPHRWRFFRVGGFDQVRIDSADDLRHLGELDQKLWSALACPTSDLEFDERTLALIDLDGDGQIRQPEILTATSWLCRVLNTPEIVFEDGDSVPLAALNEADEEGAALRAAARDVLAILGKPEADAIALADVADRTRLFSADHYNGDGMVPAALAGDEKLAAAIKLILDTVGGAADLSGEAGVDEASLAAFFEQAQQVSDWRKAAEDNAADILPLGDATAGAADLFDAVRAKIDDYFTRCRLAAFDARATTALNPADAFYNELGPHTLNTGNVEITALPLALAAADQPLPLSAGLNPAWAARIAELRETVITPVLGAREALSEADWNDLSARFAAYRGWLAGKPDSPLAVVDVAQLRALLADDTRERLALLIADDLTADAAAGPIAQLERLTRYRRDLVTLLRNFVNFADFYGRQKKAIFQAGTLYLDQRSCELVLSVPDMAKHTKLAGLSGAYLVYCKCVRKGEKPIDIVAAMTGGDADEMMVPGRNGVFYDRAGRDWNASVVKVVEAPISVRQAFWSPYKRIARMIGQQLEKFAASRDKAVESKAQAGIAEGAAKAESGAAPAAAPAAFDIAKFAGIFAAIGLAVGAIGTALAAVVSGLLSLPLWQLPVVVLAVMLLISGPSMMLAALKLRRRNLGPLLDANGWAINARARINIPFGGSLTGIPQLPPGASRSLDDPFADKRRIWPWWLALILVAIAVITAWQKGLIG